ncbi:MAG: biotin--[Solobacterium sp.]|nr:biotin--[acetyl-CoA-carboxylase] ligase [Solobacterium sp.]
MALKDELLREFSLHPMTVINGEELASRYNVSRAAVWKAVKALKSEGFDIVSSASGYMFTENNDFLSSEAVSRMVPEITAPVYVFEEIDSTNNYAKVLAAQNAPHGTLVLANHQTAGRGRQGHSFYSPSNSGLYFSLIIHPEHTEYISRITPAAAVSSVEAVETVTGIRPGIKWVNDLFLGKKKIAGILSEAVTDFETGRISSVIIGIGINCRTMAFPDDISHIAGSLEAESISRNALAATLRQRLLYHIDHLDDPAMMDLYRRDSIVLGKEITYTYNNGVYTGLAEAINDDGNILIKKPDGTVQTLQSGEISIKDW